MDNSEPTKLMCDNQNVIKLLENLVFHDQTKHITIIHHFIKDKVAKKEIKSCSCGFIKPKILAKPLG
jgi:hypothetical protein